jgi:ribosome-associated protein
LTELIRTALEPPKPRVATRPTRASKERRLTSKRERANVKRTRTDRGWERDA